MAYVYAKLNSAVGQNYTKQARDTIGKCLAWLRCRLRAQKRHLPVPE